MPRGKNPPSGQFGRGQRQPHIGASRSQSGQPQYSQTPKPRRGGSGGVGQIITEAIFGPGPRNMTHGGTKKNRGKGRSR